MLSKIEPYLTKQGLITTKSLKELIKHDFMNGIWDITRIDAYGKQQFYSLSGDTQVNFFLSKRRRGACYLLITLPDGHDMKIQIKEEYDNRGTSNRI